jgi:hypothetical protein
MSWGFEIGRVYNRRSDIRPTRPPQDHDDNATSRNIPRAHEGVLGVRVLPLTGGRLP